MKENLIQKETFEFSLRIIKLYQYLVEEKHQYEFAKQVLRSGTSIGANVEESIGGQSQKDFLSKLYIAYKEARETHYWLRLLKASDLIDTGISDSLLSDCERILRILGKIISTTRSKINN
jgi:four helix bundle protein